jgi:glycine betaine/proline transport system ATP-binding protein
VRAAPAAAIELGVQRIGSARLTTRLTIEKVTKVFSDHPEHSLPLLAAGATKDRVHSETGAVVALNGISLAVPAGAIYMIMGLSGSGKSTLARCVNRLIEPTAGRILLDGEDIVTASPQRLRELRRTRMSMVFQHFALLPHKSVVENVEFGLKLRGTAAPERRKKAEEFLAIVGLEKWAGYRPSSLSGGMRQRVGLARALATDADVLIMDEAFSALDPLIRSEMQDELLQIQKMLHKTILFITHDFQEALKLGTRIAILSDGMVVREGTPQEIVLDPRSDYVAAFTRDVDRARLFDAASVMTPAEPIVIAPDGALSLPARIAGGQAFVVDGGGRFLGAVAASDAAALRGKDPDTLGLSRQAAVPMKAKLIEVAKALNAAEQLAVTDEDGRLVGCIRGEQVLARIGQSPATATR